MGVVVSKFRNLVNFRKTEKMYRLLLLGLDSAGKSTMLYQLKTGERVATRPTVGFQVEHVTFNNFHFSIWDLGGQDKLRDIWRQYYPGIHAVIFVVDAADIKRIDTVRQELFGLMHEVELKYAVMAIVANKQDLPSALNKQQLTEDLHLDKLEFKHKVFEVTATKAIGIESVINWLSENIEDI
mmetsp:Transcript_15930/g.24508  ORF Transcript_15930/g.24508 Transcript_15930/m.24508 type:complete len:183 (+) Transcript_15930:43-591(+)